MQVSNSTPTGGWVDCERPPAAGGLGGQLGLRRPLGGRRRGHQRVVAARGGWEGPTRRPEGEQRGGSHWPPPLPQRKSCPPAGLNWLPNPMCGARLALRPEGENMGAPSLEDAPAVPSWPLEPCWLSPIAWRVRQARPGRAWRSPKRWARLKAQPRAARRGCRTGWWHWAPAGTQMSRRTAGRPPTWGCCTPCGWAGRLRSPPPTVCIRSPGRHESSREKKRGCSHFPRRSSRWRRRRRVVAPLLSHLRAVSCATTNLTIHRPSRATQSMQLAARQG